MKMYPKIPIFDGHNDSIQSTFLEKRGKGITILDDSGKGQVDIHKAQKGGMVGGFFAIQTPPEKLEERSNAFGFHIDKNGYYIDSPTPLRQEYAEKFTNQVLEHSNILEKRSRKRIKIIKNVSDISIDLSDPLSVLLHIEGAEAIKEDLSNLDSYYEKGVRSLGLFWSRKNAFGTGVQYRFPSNPDIGDGLTTCGKNLIRECNKLGIIVDLAHINEKGFWDAVATTAKPLVVTHTTVNAICASSRSLTDKQIDAIGDSNGVIGILFEPFMINPEGLKLSKGESLDNVFKRLIKTPITEIVRHIEYIINRIGINHVAFGADMDGAIMPSELRDTSEYQNIVRLLYDSGYDKESIEKICYKNWLRVIRETIHNF